MDDTQVIYSRVTLHAILNDLGYSKVKSEQRVKIYDNASRCLERVTIRNWFENFEVSVLGSRGEGIAVALGSDMDILKLQPAVMCFKTFPVENDETIDKYVATFELHFDDVPEGYVKLHLKTIQNIQWPDKYNKLVMRINRALTNEKYLKNNERIIEAVENEGENVRIEGWLSEHFQHEEASGPAQPLQFPLPMSDRYLSIDNVPAFPCEYPSFFDEWFERVQDKSWPSEETSMQVKRSKLFVVPVGLAESNAEELQWRISCTLAERLLVRSFIDAQIKAYTAMKMILKHVLKPTCEYITSYQVKNVMFWVSEKNNNILNITDFNDILLEAIDFLKQCLEVRCLKHYFILSKNLMFGELSDEERSCLFDRFNEIQRDITGILRRCTLIHELYTLPEDEVQKRLLFRNLVDEILTAILSIDPEKFETIEHSFHRAKTKDDFIKLFKNEVLTVVKQINPYGYFELLSSKSDGEILGILIQGKLQGYDKEWLD
jgi:hypothetical protein